MMLTNWLLSLALAAARAPAAEPAPSAEAGEGALEVQWEAPSGHIAGRPFLVQVTIERRAEEGAVVAGVDADAGAPSRSTARPLTERAQQRADASSRRRLHDQRSTSTSRRSSTSAGDVQARLRQRAARRRAASTSASTRPRPRASTSWTMPGRGARRLPRAAARPTAATSCVEFWPDVAPNHVRNFLDLAADGLLRRHDVPPRDPGLHDPGRRSRPAPAAAAGRARLKAEFSTKKHVPRRALDGALGRTRTRPRASSSSCTTASVQALDGQYSAFGKLVSGLRGASTRSSTRPAADRRRTARTSRR